MNRATGGSAGSAARASRCGLAGRPAYPRGVMTETNRADRRPQRPRRDADGLVATVGDLLGVVLAGLVCGVVVLLAFEAVTALARLSDFGRSSGWLAVLLPAWLFTDDFRAAPHGAPRIVVALLGAGFGVAAGLTAAGLAAALPPLFSGAVGASVATVVYALIWFYGLRWLSHRTR